MRRFPLLRSSAPDVTSSVHGVRCERGVWSPPLDAFFRNSPDGAVSPTKIVHIRCPFILKTKRLAALASRSFFVKKTACGSGYELNLQNDIGRDYYHQIQGAMYVSGARECDLIVWSALDQAVITVRKNPAWKRRHLLSLENFYYSTYLPVFLQEVGKAYSKKNECYHLVGCPYSKTFDD